VVADRLAHGAGDRGDVDLVVHQAAADLRQRDVGGVGAGLQRQADVQAHLGGHLVGVAIVRAVGPDDGADGHAGVFADQVGAGLEVLAHAGAVFGVVLVAPAGRQVLARGRRGLFVALRVGQHAAVQVVRVGGQLDQAGLRHFAQLRPGHEEVVRHFDLGAEADLGAGRRVGPAGDDGDHRGIVEFLQQGKHLGVGAGVAVVEGQQDGARRQRAHAGARIDDLLHADGVESLHAYPLEQIGQRARLDGELIGHVRKRGAQVVAHVVHAQHPECQAVVGIGGREHVHLVSARGQHQQAQRAAGKPFQQGPMHGGHGAQKGMFRVR